MRRHQLIVGVAVALTVTAGCAADPTESDEYRRLEEQYGDARAEVAALEQALADAPAAWSTSDVEFVALPEDVVPVYGEFGGCQPVLGAPVDVDGVAVYDGRFTCPEVRYSDPRLVGDVELTLVGARYVAYAAGSTIPGTARFEYTAVLTTDDGERWSGEGFGVDLYDSEGVLHTVFYDELAGEGRYDGLIFREWGMQQPALYDGSTPTPYDGYFISGWIEQVPAAGS